MLSELSIYNFAIIQNLEVSFKPGLNILTGETGAGKSILVGAVNLILGSRASQEMIRTGANEATVEGVFPDSWGGALRELLGELDLQPGSEIIVRRSINRSGRNRAFINDQQVSLQQLQQLAKGLISISGQHEHQLLLDPEVHLGLLDTFGHLGEACVDLGRVYAEWSRTQESLKRLRQFKLEQASKIDWMRFQLQELESAKLLPDEDNELESERNILRHAATLRDAAKTAHESLYAGKGAVLEQLAQVEKQLATLRQIDPSLGHLSDNLDQARIHLQELAHSLHQYSQQILFDPHRMSSVEDRLTQIHRLGKKYGPTVEAMLIRIRELRETLGIEEDADFREERMQKELDELRDDYLRKAQALSSRRRQAAEHLSKEIEGALAALDMQRARFDVGFGPTQTTDPAMDIPFTPTGLDRLEFLLSANPGEELKPLARVASGGELSRILLALKSILSRKGEAETLVFDEVDTGIGGRTAELVGLQLMRLAEKHQVICITHLPQIACYGEHHYKVAKEASGEETTASIRILSSENRVEELARMLGGISITDNAIAHAKELLQLARKRS